MSFSRFSTMIRMKRTHFKLFLFIFVCLYWVLIFDYLTCDKTNLHDNGRYGNHSQTGNITSRDIHHIGSLISADVSKQAVGTDKDLLFPVNISKKSVHNTPGINKNLHQTYLLQNANDTIFRKWTMNNIKMCNNNFVGFGNSFAILKNVFINPNQVARVKEGGENLSSVINQKEEKEFIQLKPGYFSLKCNQKPSYKFFPRDHLNQWIKVTDGGDIDAWSRREETFTVVVQRYEYVNMYHTMTDWYSVFLMCLFFNKEPQDTRVIWVDAHPTGSLDGVWSTLYGNVTRAGSLQEPVLFKEMVWAITGYFTPLNMHKLPKIPYIEEFSDFFLRQYGINKNNGNLDCFSLNVLFIWRRDYIAHARNPSGFIKRKFDDEAGLLGTIANAYPHFNVQGKQMDKLSIAEQLKLIANTDILIGMHGAGLSLTLFLPKHAGLIEIYPKYWPSSNVHFKSFAKWRNLKYSMWKNKDPKNELPDFYTNVPKHVLLKLFNEMVSKICNI